MIQKSIRDTPREGRRGTHPDDKEMIEIQPQDEADTPLSCAHASEKVLGRDWDTPEDDETWSSL